MISIDRLVVACLHDLKAGSLFVECKDGTPFVAGTVNEYDVLVSLGGEAPFTWQDAIAGATVAGFSFQA